MRSKLAIDFGTSNTVLSYWDSVAEDTNTLHVSGLSRLLQQNQVEVSLIPSQIHYAGTDILVGQQVSDANLETSEKTFRNLKTYIRKDSPLTQVVGKRSLSYQQMGRDFLTCILKKAYIDLMQTVDEIAITVPVESLEIYNKWLIETIDVSKQAKFRFLDEPVAAALGYGAKIAPGDCYLVFDFGGGTLDVAVVNFGEPQEDSEINSCRVVGKAGVDIGGADIDRWVAEEILRKNNCSFQSEEAKAIKQLLLKECELVKQRLSSKDLSHGLIMNPLSGKAFDAELSRAELESLLERKQLFRRVKETVSRALTQAEERGFHRDDIKRAMLVGGCSLMPSVQRTLKEMFGEHRVLLDRPLDAVARGAQILLQGAKLVDFLRHDYAIKSRGFADDPYTYNIIVSRGTQYPSTGPVKTITVKGTSDGQTDLRLEIYEVAMWNDPKAQDFELNFGSSSQVPFQSVILSSPEYFWINQSNPTFLVAEPPAERGESRFKVEFYLDENRRLLISTTDLKTGRKLHKMYPVIKLR